MSRKRLSDLLLQPEEPEPQTPKQPDSVSLEEDESSLPLYQRLVRKEARLTEEQLSGLVRLARHLNRKRKDKSQPRITENSLIRVAVAFLLQHQDLLEGSSEEELLATLLARVRRDLGS